jgi:hypothetical protein
VARRRYLQLEEVEADRQLRFDVTLDEYVNLLPDLCQAVMWAAFRLP